MVRSKYYVWSGDLQVVLLAENPVFAALDAYDKFATLDMDVDGSVFVGERGFHSEVVEVFSIGDIVLYANEDLDNEEA